MFVFIDNHNKSLYLKYYDSFSQLRYQTFIKELNWDVPHHNGREFDQFDHDEAHYIILINQSQNVVGGIRLMPTESPHMLRDVFSYLVDKGKTPLGKSIWEISRLVIKKLPCDNIADMRYRFQELIEALVTFAVLHNIQDYVSVSETRVERLFRMAGLPMKRLGSVVMMNGVGVVATQMSLTADVITKVTSKYFQYGSVLYNSKSDKD